jgi:hypothetical protein
MSVCVVFFVGGCFCVCVRARGNEEEVILCPYYLFSDFLFSNLKLLDGLRRW